jgi:hypothetical protein
MTNTWCRLHSEMLDDLKVQSLSPEAFKVWINCLCLATKVNSGGRIGTLDETAFAFRMKRESVSPLLSCLIEKGLIETLDETFHVSKWRKRQYKSTTSTERVKRHRKRSRNVSETPPDTDTDTDTEKKKSTKKSQSAEVLAELQSVLSPAVAEAVVEHRKKMRKPLTKRGAELLAARLGKTGNPDGAADLMIERGWQGINPDWDEVKALAPTKQKGLSRRDALRVYLATGSYPDSRTDRPPTSREHAEAELQMLGTTG